jgi:hypothetical protein
MMADDDGTPALAGRDAAAGAPVGKAVEQGAAPPATPASAPASAPSPAPSSTGSQSRPHYTPQFSAATEMILKRIRGEPTSLSSAISSASAAGAIKQSTYEDTKRRLVMSMNTSLTLPMPASASLSLSSPSSTPAKNGTNPSKVLPGAKVSRGRPPKAELENKAKTPRGAKRKRGKDEDGSPTPSDAHESDDEEYQDAAVPTMTKSGRQVLKPSQFNPVVAPAGGKRKHYGKRTPEQALCKVCTRGLSPAGNQIVFCDGCNSCWHQLCHDPYIDDEFVSDESRSWFCRSCMAKREKHLAKKKTMEGFKGASWAAKSAEQRRVYLAGLPQSQLVNMVMYSLELHPDLPLFPEANGPRRGRPPSGVQTQGSPLPSATSGPAHFSPSLLTPDTPAKKGKNMEQNEREESTESVPPAWPKAGEGVLAGLAMNEDDFQDKNDFEAFSVATYSEGKKIVENGMPVTEQERNN